MQENSLQPSKRLDYLDATRGIAAMMVLVGHYINWKFDQNIIVRLSSFVFNANDAVSFFFVLSGLVLSWTYLQNPDKKLFINQFYVSRIYRLFPGFIFALLTNLIYVNRHELTMDHAFDVFIKNSQKFWDELVLLRFVNKFYLPGWTLSVELCMSFLMPFIIVIAKYNRRLLFPLLISLLITINIVTSSPLLFGLGVFIAAYYNEISSPAFKNNKWYKRRYWLIPLGILLFSIRMIDKIQPIPKFLQTGFDFLKIDFFTLTGIAAFIFIIFIIASQSAQKVLQIKPLLFLGKISYGIYLSHWLYVIIYYQHWDSWFYPLFNNTLYTFLFGLIIIIIMSIITATLIYKFIELPFLSRGRKVVQKMKQKIYV